MYDFKSWMQKKEAYKWQNLFDNNIGHCVKPLQFKEIQSMFLLSEVLKIIKCQESTFASIYHKQTWLFLFLPSPTHKILSIFMLKFIFWTLLKTINIEIFWSLWKYAMYFNIFWLFFSNIKMMKLGAPG